MGGKFVGAWKFFSVLFSLALFVFPLAPAVFAQDYSSSNFIIREPVIGGGGANTTSPSFQINEGLGEVAAGIGTGLTFTVVAGFFPFFIISATSVPPTPPTLPPSGGPRGGVGGGLAGVERAPSVCDFNSDGKCNIIDLSILLFYYNRSGPSVSRYDLSRDGTVDFVDVSILFYYWFS